MATNTEKIVVQVVVKGQGELEKLNQGTKKTTKGFAGLTKGVGAAAAGILAAVAAFRKMSQLVSSSIKTFKNFEFEMAKVKAITGATDSEFKKLTFSARELGKTTFFTATQVAQLQVNYGKLGFTTQEILDAQAATIDLATATQSDLARAAIVAGAAVRGFGLDASETQRVVDVMAVAFTSSAMDIEKFQTSMTKVAPIAKSAGFSLEDTTAIMSKLTDAAPLLTLPWLVAISDESNILAQGTTPSLLPFPVISFPRVLMRDNEIPTPPPDAVSFISSALVNPIPRIESGVSTPKHEIGKPLSVPVFESTGDAKPIQPFQIYLKNLDSKSSLFSLITIA